MQPLPSLRRHFNPRSPHGERPAIWRYAHTRRRYFNPRSPHGERRPSTQTTGCLLTFQPTLPARGATRHTRKNGAQCRISTHAPRTGSDNIWRYHPAAVGNFNPRSPHGERLIFAPNLCNLHLISTHAPRTGSDFCYFNRQRIRFKFQPTLPARGATTYAVGITYKYAISTHAPRTGSDAGDIVEWGGADISTHAPRTGSDRCPMIQATVVAHFNPRSPHGERRQVRRRVRHDACISTHAPRTGSDWTVWGHTDIVNHFNPRSPHGERHSARIP